MRRALSAISFVILVAALGLIWAHRFEHDAGGGSVWRLSDLRGGVPAVAGVEWLGTPEKLSLRLRVDDRNPRVAIRLAIPGISAVEGLHLRFRMSARGLIPGKEPWESGRFMIEWHRPDGGPEVELDPVAGIKLDQKGDSVALIALPESGPAIPALRLEHLGRAGDFQLSDLEITAVHERALWKTGRWVLALGWLVWIAALIRMWPGISRGRALGAAMICLLMGIHFVIPGPWKVQRAISGDFQLGELAGPSVPAEAPPSVTAKTAVDIPSGTIAATGKIPVQGSFALRLKYAIKQARPLLHALLLLGPTLGLAFLVGRKHALMLALALALLIESAQFAFGYGFGWDDVWDLLNDGIGIALALWIHRRFMASRSGGTRPPMIMGGQ
ncbi:MAG: hypothetical protein Q8Q59_03540 [Luteolibacter sp.]|jgi:hypothetical protein|nr:hypothetical protein [Luteolibacter sp.]